MEQIHQFLGNGEEPFVVQEEVGEDNRKVGMVLVKGEFEFPVNGNLLLRTQFRRRVRERML
jgi:hypothetical protein